MIRGFLHCQAIDNDKDFFISGKHLRIGILVVKLYIAEIKINNEDIKIDLVKLLHFTWSCHKFFNDLK